MRLTDFQFGCAAACAPPASQLRRCALECRQLDTHIAQCPPKVFVTLDPLATERLTGIRAPQIVLRGYIYPERQGRGWVIPTMPLGGKAKGPTLEQSPGMCVTWRADIAKALRGALEKLGRLEFLPVDPQRFPALALVRAALAAGESAPAVFNAANEVAVAAFLAGRIPFPAIVETARRVLERHRPERLGSLADALAWDAWGRARAAEILPALAG